MKRVFLFVVTNLAIVTVLGIVWQLLGMDQWLAAQGVNAEFGFVLVLAVVFGMGGSFVSLLLSKWSALRMTGAEIIQNPRNQTEAWLVNTVHQQAQAAGIGKPDVAIYRSADLNAFATGANRSNALVAVSTGLLEHMRREEVEAVLGHEVSHIANGDMITLALIQGVVNTFVILLSRVVGYFVDRVVLKNQRGHGPGFWITTIVAQMVLGVLASIIVMWFSRRREFRADDGGARLAGTANMIAALQRLKSGVDREHLPDQMAAFGISGGGKTGLARLFMTHPPLDERIEALRQQQ